jgi:acyl-CoA synthetase (AMP-forming)/AMP-acid ligase II
MLTVGGDRIAPGHVAELLSINPHLALYLTYGLTEAGPRVSTLAAHREPPRRHGSVGRPLTGVTTTLRPVPGPAGGAELLVASDTVMIAKVGDAAAERTLIAPGVVATGDLFRIDDDGYLYFEGRLSDFAVIRGEKVSLYSVRQLVQSLPGVVRCATRLGVDEHGASHFDLDIQVAGDAAGAEPRLRRALGSFLLPSERPRSIAVGRAELAVFQK